MMIVTLALVLTCIIFKVAPLILETSVEGMSSNLASQDLSHFWPLVIASCDDGSIADFITMLSSSTLNFFPDAAACGGLEPLILFKLFKFTKRAPWIMHSFLSQPNCVSSVASFPENRSLLLKLGFQDNTAMHIFDENFEATKWTKLMAKMSKINPSHPILTKWFPSIPKKLLKNEEAIGHFDLAACSSLKVNWTPSQTLYKRTVDSIVQRKSSPLGAFHFFRVLISQSSFGLKKARKLFIKIGKALGHMKPQGFYSFLSQIFDLRRAVVEESALVDLCKTLLELPWMAQTRLIADIVVILAWRFNSPEMERVILYFGIQRIPLISFHFIDMFDSIQLVKALTLAPLFCNGNFENCCEILSINSSVPRKAVIPNDAKIFCNTRNRIKPQTVPQSYDPFEEISPKILKQYLKQNIQHSFQGISFEITDIPPLPQTKMSLELLYDITVTFEELIIVGFVGQVPVVQFDLSFDVTFAFSFLQYSLSRYRLPAFYIEKQLCDAMVNGIDQRNYFKTNYGKGRKRLPKDIDIIFKHWAKSVSANLDNLEGGPLFGIPRSDWCEGILGKSTDPNEFQ